MENDPVDVVDVMLTEWGDVQPQLDVSPMAIIGRISRLSRLIDRRLAQNFARHGLENWMYDVLATLRRIGEPYEMSPTTLVEHTMVTTGSMTNRIDRLVERGLVERHHDRDDRRRVIVRLTRKGLDLVDHVAPSHYALEHELVAPLTSRDRQALATALRSLLLELGDHPSPATRR